MSKVKLQKDDHGNDPFWYRCSTMASYDELPVDYKLVSSVFDFITIDPIDENNHIKMDLYSMKKGFFAIKKDKYVVYEISEELNDYDVEEYIKQGKCFIKIDE